MKTETRRRRLNYSTVMDEEKGCKIHREVVDKCVEAITEPDGAGFFEKVEILDVLGYTVMADSIYWDYIKRHIEEKYGTELVPLTQYFFSTQHRRDLKKAKGNQETISRLYGRAIAGGNGKKTVGYASIVNKLIDGALVIRRLKRKANRTSGDAKSFENTTSIIKQKRPSVFIDYVIEEQKLLD